jgi:hypothetical protein
MTEEKEIQEYKDLLSAKVFSYLNPHNRLTIY